MKLSRPAVKTLIAAGASAALIASGGAAYAVYDAAAAPSTAPALPGSAGSASAPQLAATGVRANASAGTGAANRPGALRHLGHLVIGELTSVSTTGGTASAGTISVRVPDGQTVTANLAPRTRVLAYQGPGTKPTAESVSQLRTDEMVAVRLAVRRTGAGAGAGSAPAGPSATATGSSGAGSPAVLTASSPAGSTGTPYAVLIVDLGYTAASPSGS